MYCENCKNEHIGQFGSGRFCSQRCASSFSTKSNRKEINAKVGEKLKGRKLTEKQKEAIKFSWNKRRGLERKPNKNRTSLENLLIENSTYTTQCVKRRLLQENAIDYECKECGNKGIHNNKPLTLQLDHINGNNRDHRMENLRLLCPSCHSQTDTYGSKKRY
jgi:5-methylcytosine-specific restriction endonuclease McrA